MASTAELMTTPLWLGLFSQVETLLGTLIFHTQPLGLVHTVFKDMAWVSFSKDLQIYAPRVPGMSMNMWLPFLFQQMMVNSGHNCGWLDVYGMITYGSVDRISLCPGTSITPNPQVTIPYTITCCQPRADVATASLSTLFLYGENTWQWNHQLLLWMQWECSLTYTKGDALFLLIFCQSRCEPCILYALLTSMRFKNHVAAKRVYVLFCRQKSCVHYSL